MTARKPHMEIACPACGHRFGLEGSIAAHLEQLWRDRERAAMRRQVASEIDEKAAVQASKLASAQVRDAREEVRERERKIAGLRSQLTKLQRKLPAARAQELGVERQRTLLEVLQARFPSDRFREIRRGTNGADLIQEVFHNNSTYSSGSILWESKRASAWAKSWTTKLAADQRSGDNTIAVIVSEVLPDEESVVMQIDSVWACRLEVAPELATALRHGIVQAGVARGSSARREDLKGRVFDYLVSQSFAQRVASVVTMACQIRAGVDTERRVFGTRWAERERQADSIVGELAAVYGELRGIGASVAPIGELELTSEPLGLRALNPLDTADLRQPTQEDATANG